MSMEKLLIIKKLSVPMLL